MSSVTVLSPSERAARAARPLPSSSVMAHCSNITSFRCMGRDSRLYVVLLLAVQDNEIYHDQLAYACSQSLKKLILQFD